MKKRTKNSEACTYSAPGEIKCASFVENECLQLLTSLKVKMKLVRFVRFAHLFQGRDVIHVLLFLYSIVM